MNKTLDRATGVQSHPRPSPVRRVDEAMRFASELLETRFRNTDVDTSALRRTMERTDALLARCGVDTGTRIAAAFAVPIDRPDPEALTYLPAHEASSGPIIALKQLFDRSTTHHPLPALARALECMEPHSPSLVLCALDALHALSEGREPRAPDHEYTAAADALLAWPSPLGRTLREAIAHGQRLSNAADDTSLLPAAHTAQDTPAQAYRIEARNAAPMRFTGHTLARAVDAAGNSALTVHRSEGGAYLRAWWTRRTGAMRGWDCLVCERVQPRGSRDTPLALARLPEDLIPPTGGPTRERHRLRELLRSALGAMHAPDTFLCVPGAPLSPAEIGEPGTHALWTAHGLYRVRAERLGTAAGRLAGAPGPHHVLRCAAPGPCLLHTDWGEDATLRAFPDADTLARFALEHANPGEDCFLQIREATATDPATDVA